MKLYEQVKEIMSLAVKDDDLMRQETLFEIQDKIAALALKIAIYENKTEDLVREFPWWYEETKGE